MPREAPMINAVGIFFLPGKSNEKARKQQPCAPVVNRAAYTSSIAIAVASPPPMHRAATPRLPPVFFKAPSRVTMMRAPEAPIGWPSAHAPPWMLILLCAMSRSCMAAIGTAANASLISNKSTLLLLQPVFAYSFLMAPMGAVVNSFGACACVAWPWILAMTVQPSFFAVDSRISTRAAAPSLIDEDEAAVMVPSFLNAAFKVGIFSRRAF